MRTAAKLKQMLKAIFDVAAEDCDIKSPMAKIILPHYKVKKGRRNANDGVDFKRSLFYLFDKTK